MAVDARCRIVGLFCYILFLHSLAIIFFTRGFLLTRTELPEFSTCSDVAKSGCFGKYTALSDTGNLVFLPFKSHDFILLLLLLLLVLLFLLLLLLRFLIFLDWCDSLRMFTSFNLDLTQLLALILLRKLIR